MCDDAVAFLLCVCCVFFLSFVTTLDSLYYYFYDINDDIKRNFQNRDSVCREQLRKKKLEKLRIGLDDEQEL